MSSAYVGGDLKALETAVSFEHSFLVHHACGEREQTITKMRRTPTRLQMRPRKLRTTLRRASQTF
ncbi:hypothetical protein DACRYDRAFT_21063 [Dacryopinax primogenitus]|uniref:Uncharacterized protein n=1 Tax=Dacryopinax primogenitus (strain DJM 731) TaxID=1858805 RepID=M5GBP2_DACPD|nr:uncharacterized protein DACRYDRAFT_21063 [Dacryopinax primogenitus]EJU03482.1 hypothetical protein DACRYDRAFT_21063 [Dacryopinax primogenitus]